MTRIYSASTNINNLDLTLIEGYKSKSKSKKDSTFFSESGIFSMYKDELVKHVYNDVDILQHQVGNIKLAIDKSIVQKQRYHYQLPYGYLVQRTETVDYKLCDNSEVKLVIVFENNIPIDLYFYTKQDYTHPEVENAVSTFLSLLNFY